MSIRDNYPAYDQCPCESGRKTKFCCFQNRKEWIKRPAVIAPPSPITGYSNLNCYAHSTMDCSIAMSDEHYISHSILRTVELNGTSKIGGLPWIPPETFRILPSKRLSAKVLCVRHNNALSPLDAEAGRLIKAIGQFDQTGNESTYLEEIKIFCGEDIERWMLKTICSMQAGGQISKNRVGLRRDVPKQWIDILYGNVPWPEYWGLYAPAPLGATWHHSSSFSFEPLSHPSTEEVMAVKMEINGLPMNLALCRFDNPPSFGIQRPRTFIFRNIGHLSSKYIELSWVESRWNRYLLFTRQPPYSGPSPQWPEWARK